MKVHKYPTREFIQICSGDIDYLSSPVDETQASIDYLQQVGRMYSVVRAASTFGRKMAGTARVFAPSLHLPRA